ncbi:MAG TPA: ABC transporter permease [Bryobacteraceae bacterium]|jgi:predicted permease|nr:ABC transporter permease [Bryobacteraceae bacterium]
MWKRLRSLYRVLTGRRQFEDGMSEELRFHIEQFTDDLIHRGKSPEKAARLARIEFGSVQNIKTDCREARGLQLVDELLRESRYAVRSLRKTPGFTATALLTLGICLGANLTIFAVMDSILLRPLPFPDPGRLVTMFNSYPKAGVDRDGSSITNYYERRGRIPAFQSLSLYSYGASIIGEAGSTERAQITYVSPEFFTTLGVAPRFGRVFTEAETTQETNNVAMLTDTYWRQRFNADQHVIGRQIRVDGIPKTVIGVLPPNFRFLSSESRLYLPFASSPQDRAPSERHSGGNSKQLIARLQPGATLEQAQSQIDAQNTTLEVDDPKAKMLADAGFRSLVTPLHADHVASVRPTLLLMQSGALALLLIGAINLVNLLLIRATGRSKEMAVRQALGANRRHVVSEVIVEITLLTLAGGLLGLGLGAAGIRLLTRLGVDRLPLGATISFDARLASVALIAAVLIGILLAVPIAWFNLRDHLTNRLQAESRGGTSGRSAQRLRHGFIVGQIALALALLTSAGLLGLSLERAAAISPGFQPEHVLTGRISLPFKTYPNGLSRVQLIERLTKEVGRLPGVLASGVVDNVPFSGNSGKSAATVKGYVLRPGETLRGHYSYAVGGDYFSTLGIALRAGRFLTSADSRRTQRVCVVDEDFARYYWPNSSAIGQRLFEGGDAGDDAEAFTVVGVVGAVKQAGLTDDAAQGAVYYPYMFRVGYYIFITARTSLSPESLASMLQTTVRRIDPELPVSDIRSMETRIADSLMARRSPALLAGVFSAIALLLTAIGTYGVLSYAVTERRREIGVRMALGARPEQIRNQFFSLALRLLAAGTTLGMLGGLLAGRAMRAVLFHVPPIDPAILAGAAAIIGSVSLAACLVPSHRAARISPMEVLQ